MTDKHIQWLVILDGLLTLLLPAGVVVQVLTDSLFRDGWLAAAGVTLFTLALSYFLIKDHSTRTLLRVFIVIQVITILVGLPLLTPVA